MTKEYNEKAHVCWTDLHVGSSIGFHGAPWTLTRGEKGDEFDRVRELF